MDKVLFRSERLQSKYKWIDIGTTVLNDTPEYYVEYNNIDEYYIRGTGATIKIAFRHLLLQDIPDKYRYDILNYELEYANQHPYEYRQETIKEIQDNIKKIEDNLNNKYYILI